MIVENGEVEFDSVDDANIPVNIFLTQDDETKKWTLNADLLMPRKGMVTDMFEATADSREEMVEIIRKHILPLYEVAVAKLEAICDGSANQLYYWEK